MRYDVRVAPHSGGQETRFEHEQDEPLKVDDPIQVPGMSYRVKSIQPLSVEESEDFDAIVHAEWFAGPAQSGFN